MKSATDNENDNDNSTLLIDNENDHSQLLSDNDNDHSRWLDLRRKTFVAFCFISFGLGFEYSLIFPSLLYYLKEVIRTEYAELCYGIALSAYPTASIIGAFTIARYIIPH